MCSCANRLHIHVCHSELLDMAPRIMHCASNPYEDTDMAFKCAIYVYNVGSVQTCLRSRCSKSPTSTFLG